MTREFRTRAAVVLLVGGCVGFAVERLRPLVIMRSKGFVHTAQAGEQRFRAVAPQLPRTGTVGYVPAVTDPNLLDDVRQFGLPYARYSLAPLRVEPGSDYDLVLVDTGKTVRVVSRPHR